MRKFMISLGALIAIIAVIGVVMTRIPLVQKFLFKEAVAHRVNLKQAPLDASDELSVLLCGTGSPLPDPDRAGPCAMVAAGERLYVVDVGFGSVQKLLQWRIPMKQIAAVLLTHMHSDHIPELGEIRLQTWVAGRSQHLPVYGPPGVGRVVAGFEEVYALDSAYRTLHHGADFLPIAAAPMEAHPVPIPAGQTTAVVLAQDGLKITAIRVDHGPVKPAYGYRFDYHGRSIVISGDTAPDHDLAEAAKGADVLVHEALQPEMVAVLGSALAKSGNTRAAKIMHDIPGYHTSPVDAARIANEAGVTRLVYTHLLPPLPVSAARRLFLEGVADVRPNGVEIGDDGLLLRLPANSDAIMETRIGR